LWKVIIFLFIKIEKIILKDIVFSILKMSKLPYYILVEIFEYLPSSQIWNLQYLNGSLRKIMREHVWKKWFIFKKNLTNIEFIKILLNWKITKFNLLECNKIDDYGIEKLENVKHLCLKCSYLTTEKSIKKLKYLDELDLRYCKKITDDCVEMLGNLKKLNLRFIKKNIHDNHIIFVKRRRENITDKSIKKLGNLKKLNLCACDALTYESIVELKNVENLNLSFTEVNDRIVKELKNVKKLNLRACDCITDKGIEGLRNVKKINLRGCYLVTDEGIKGLKNIKELNLHLRRFDISKITRECIQWLQDNGVEVRT